MERALYGPEGFYRVQGGPAAHFRTSAHVSPLFAGALLTLVEAVDAALGRPDPFDVVDVGAGGGELIAELWRQAPDTLRARARFIGVELAERPPELPARVRWRADIPELTGLLIANEWLDNVPLDIAERSAEGTARYVLVDPGTGSEELGPPLESDAAGWFTSWGSELGAGFVTDEPSRMELGLTRDQAWASAIKQVRAGAALAIDYEARNHSTLAGYRGGRQVRPVPDGACDITAHVFFDSLAAAGVAAGARTAARLSQREALDSLGLSAARPPLELARRDPSGYLKSLQRTSASTELMDSTGLGGFTWLLQTVQLSSSSLPL